MNAVFDLAKSLSRLQMTEEDMALFSAAVLLSPGEIVFLYLNRIVGIRFVEAHILGHFSISDYMKRVNSIRRGVAQHFKHLTHPLQIKIKLKKIVPLEENSGHNYIGLASLFKSCPGHDGVLAESQSETP